ncbi:hypothetical protein T2_00006 [Ralstonia phage Elie]|uniref:Uncharacterized protein n=2 Tax=Bakolyvirus simangalove TaxID=2846051 RepID=A0A7G5BBN5_9CAUD|nr:hypothetical protein KE332_gp06 [Ralstonia phage Adzire]YP_010077693.1 hypothetical protein KMC38_gp06 [Ralstonia phage Simangalove]QMV32951.1 hypothetical protein T2_00006 [Ralstonia phage Elie]QMV33663.1 hypothetical protein S3_00019 [Ralstonia phage Sarlave]QMV32323.1 hypothetical protein S1_00006 [Ralstonia phage Adzire]QMV33708.1 hypothetical protein R1_00006 [Ralstonia phage Simangalove]
MLTDRQIDDIAEAYREEYGQLCDADDMREFARRCVRAQADAQPVGWRPAFPFHRGDFTRGVPSDATIEHLRAQGVEIEYAYSRPVASEAARAEELRHALSIARDHMRIMANWIKFSDPAAHRWSCEVIDRVNTVLEQGESK